MAKSAQPTRWQRFRRIPSLKRLVLFSLFMMVGGLAALVAGVFAIHLFAPRMIGDASIAGKGKMFGGIWNSRPGKTVFGERKRVNLLIVGVDYNHDSKGIIYTKGARTDTMMVFGRPVTRSRPRISMVSSSGDGMAEPMVIFTFSAVRSPINRL